MDKEQQKQLITEIMNEDAKDGLYNKQTAVEWLAKELIKEDFYIPIGLYQQAKRMEKQQIIESFKHGEMPKLFSNLSAEQYYNEEYGKQ